MFGAEVYGATAALLAQRVNAENMMHYQAIGIENLAKVQACLAANPPKPSKLCQYCGRTNQKHGHTSCDGCGAPR